MSNSERHIDDIFSAAKDIHPQQRLFSPADLRTIVEQTPQIPVSRSTYTKHYLAMSILAASIAAGIFLWQSPAPTHNQTAPEQQRVVAAIPEQPVQREQQSEGYTTTIPSSAALPQHTLPQTIKQEKTVGDEAALAPSPLPPSLSSPSKIRGMHFIELSDNELEKLGIHRTAAGYELYTEDVIRYDDNEMRQRVAVIHNDYKISVKLSKNHFKEWYTSELGGDTTQPFAVIKHKVLLDTFTTNSEALRYPLAQCIAPVVSPLIISHDYYETADNHGKIVATFENPLLLDSTSKLNRQVFEMYNVFAPDSVVECRDVTKYPLLAKLVPVYIRMGTPKSAKHTTPGSDIILWYYPTPEFLDALPAHLANRLRIELGFTTLVEEGVLHAEELKQRYCGEYNFLDVCRAKDGALSIVSVIPNPASERATVKVRVTEQRNFTVSLHDMFGNRVAHISNLQLANSDEIAIDVANKPAGTYLIAITSDKGEQVVERLIVNH